MSEVLLLAVKGVVIIELVEVMAQDLVLDLSADYVWLARVLGQDLLEAFSGENAFDLVRLLVTRTEDLSGSGGLVTIGCHFK